jgi:hypothetical protein
MDSSIYTAPAKKGIVGCINYGLYLLSSILLYSF